MFFNEWINEQHEGPCVGKKKIFTSYFEIVSVSVKCKIKRNVWEKEIILCRFFSFFKCCEWYALWMYSLLRPFELVLHLFKIRHSWNDIFSFVKLRDIYNLCDRILLNLKCFSVKCYYNVCVYLFFFNDLAKYSITISYVVSFVR